MISSPVETQIARVMKHLRVEAGEYMPVETEPHLYLVADGEILTKRGDRVIDVTRRGGFFGEESVLFDHTPYRAYAEGPAELFAIPAHMLRDIPIVTWKLMEVFERREMTMSAEFRFEWKDEYSVHVESLDDHHRELFDLVKGISDEVDVGADRGDLAALVGTFIERVKAHCGEEERYLRERGGGDVDGHRRAHEISVKRLMDFASAFEKGEKRVTADEIVFLKEWLVTHVIGEDRDALAS
jgi:hemerythrin